MSPATVLARELPTNQLLYDANGKPIEHGACGLAAQVRLDGKGDHQVLKSVIEATRRQHARCGIVYDMDGNVLTTDGAGVLMNLGDSEKDSWLQMMTLNDRRQVEDPQYLQIGTFLFSPRSSKEVIDRTRRAIEACMHQKDFDVYGWGDVDIDPTSMLLERYKDMPIYQNMFYSTKNVPPADAVNRLYRASRRIMNDVSGANIGSLALDRVAYAGLFTAQELLDGVIKLLQYLQPSVAIAHVRFATNVGTDPRLAQPFDTIAHNGEFNSHLAVQYAVENLAHFLQFHKDILTPGGSDSAHFNDTINLLLANGISLLEALMALIPPALKTVMHPQMKQFIQASKRARGSLGMWEGPAAVMALNERYFATHNDRLGLRPHRWSLFQEDGGPQRLCVSSEAGAFGNGFAHRQASGQLGAGQGLAVDLKTGNFLHGDTLYEKILEETGLNWKQLSGSYIVVPSQGLIHPQQRQDISLCPANISHLYPLLAGFGWNYTDIEHVIERIKTGGIKMSSLGHIAPLAILRNDLRRLEDLYHAKAAYITNPPIHPEGERNSIETGVHIGRSPSISASDPRYENIYPQWLYHSSIIPNQVIQEMFRRAQTSYVGESAEIAVPSITRISTTFTGDNGENPTYHNFSKKLDNIIKAVLAMADPHSSQEKDIVLLSDREAFERAPGKSPRLYIPPLIVLQAVREALKEHGLSREISVGVDSGTIQRAHDIGVLVSHGAQFVCPYMMDHIARDSDHPHQALWNLYESLDKEFIKIMAKIGLTTTEGATGGYWHEGVGVSPVVTRAGGGKVDSRVGGLDKVGIFYQLILPQLARQQNPEQFITAQQAQIEKDLSAFNEGIRTLYHRAAHPTQGLDDLASILEDAAQKAITDGTPENIQTTFDSFLEKLRKQGLQQPLEDALRKSLSIALSNSFTVSCAGSSSESFLEAFYAVYEACSEEAVHLAGRMAFSSAIQRMEATGPRTLRDMLDILYEHPEITSEMLAQAPTMEEIKERSQQAHKSLGALSPEAHAAAVRGCKQAGIRSAGGEGGEEPERSRLGSRSIDRTEARQIGTAGWGVDRQFLMEADEICIKIGQGAKPGEGGALLGEKVTTYIAEVRNVKKGTTLISPPPNHDIYSIEDLYGRISALKELNPRATISLKIPAMANAGTICSGAVKAGADKLEISGFDGGTGASPFESIHHTGLPVEIAIAEAHQRLVGAGLRDRVTLLADGGIRTPKDYVKMLLMGADGVTFGTLVMIYLECIACINCHTGKCPTGITTQNERRRKLLVHKAIPKKDYSPPADGELDESRIQIAADGVERGLNAFFEGVRLELAKLGVKSRSVDGDGLSAWVGKVHHLQQKFTDDPRKDSLRLEKELLREVPLVQPCAFSKAATDTRRALESRLNLSNKLGRKISENAAQFLNNGQNRLTLKYDTTNEDRNLGVHTSGAVYELLEQHGLLTPQHRLIIQTYGSAGHGYGMLLGNGMTMEHTGELNDSVGQYMSGDAEIVVRLPDDALVKEGHALIGNQACYAATGGTLLVGGLAGERFLVRNSGALGIAEGALDYPMEYQTRGRGILLGQSTGPIGSLMTGGDGILYDPTHSERGKLDDQYVHSVDMTGADLDVLKKQLDHYYSSTKSIVVMRILQDWEKNQHHFVRFVSRESSGKSEADVSTEG